MTSSPLLTTSISPPEEDHKIAVLSLKKGHPALSIVKFHVLLLSENHWQCLHRILKNSEPRQRQRQKLEYNAPAAAARSVDGDTPAGGLSTASETHAYPSSALVKGLDIAKWTTAVEIKYFDRKKEEGARREGGADIRGPSRVPVCHCAGVVSVATFSIYPHSTRPSAHLPINRLLVLIRNFAIFLFLQGDT